MNKAVIFVYQSKELFFYASEIAGIIPGLQLSLLPPVLPPVYLLLKPDGLWLHTPDFIPFHLDKFYIEFIMKRRKIINKELLIKAANHRLSGQKPIALDLTAGLGRDSILLALAGYKVVMIENNPYLVLILNYLKLAFSNLLPDLTVVYANNCDFLADDSGRYDLVYYDPMFEDDKIALAKKDMQLIEFLIEGVDTKITVDNAEVWQLLKSHCCNKIIVKRDNKQPPLFENSKPTYCIKGKTVRFDVYQCATFTSK